MKKLIGMLSLFVLLASGIAAMTYLWRYAAPTYDGDADVTDLYENPDDYKVDGAQGIAEIIVDTDLEKTKAVNDVAAVVFDYRGYDTIGESFILLAAICGSFVIIRMIRKNDAEGGERREV